MTLISKILVRTYRSMEQFGTRTSFGCRFPSTSTAGDPSRGRPMPRTLPQAPCVPHAAEMPILENIPPSLP